MGQCAILYQCNTTNGIMCNILCSVIIGTMCNNLCNITRAMCNI